MRELQIRGDFELTIKFASDAPDDVLTRASDPGFPYWQMNGEPLTADQTLEHLAHNALRNGVTDLSDLDGWADLLPGMATMAVTDLDVD